MRVVNVMNFVRRIDERIEDSTPKLLMRISVII